MQDEKRDYVSEFLSLKCAGDVMNVVSPLGHNTKKEITESMGMIHKIKEIVLKEPMKYDILDLCAGNALTSVLSCFLLPVKVTYAVDKRPRTRRWNLAKRFNYVNEDIYRCNEEWVCDPSKIIISVHPCKDLANQVVKIYNTSDWAKHLVLMPCCKGTPKVGFSNFLNEKLSTYERWCLSLLASIKDSKVNMYQDKKIESPCNIIITASKI